MSTFDEIFFSKHGVGDVPIDEDFAIIAHQMNPNEPTLPEVQFCRYLIKGDSQPDAYIKAFDYDGSEHRRDVFGRMASRLLTRPRVSKKLFEMKEKVNALMDEDLSTLVDELNSDRKLARDLGQPSAAIAAVKAKAGLLGLDQNQGASLTVNVNLTDAQKGQLLNRIGKRLNPQTIEDAEFEAIPHDDE